MRPSVPPAADDDIDRRFRAAVELHQRGDIAAAAREYEDLRHQVPAHPELLHLLGTAFVQLGRAADAIPFLEQSLILRPRYAPTMEIAGTAQLMTGNAARAVTLLSDAAALEPQSIAIAMRLGDAHLACGQYDAAREAFQKVLTLDAKRPAAIVGLATALAHLGQPSEAIERLRTCTADHPAFIRAYVVLSTLLGQQDRFAEAEAAIRTGLKIQPGLAEGHHLLAKTLRRQGRAPEAEAAYRAAFDLGLRTPSVLTECGEILTDMGRLDDAEALLQEARKASPESADILTALGRIDEFRGNLDQAIKLHDRAIALDHGNANAYVNRGTARRYGGDADGALADFNQALALRPGMPAAVASRGMTLLSLGRLQEGWPDFKVRIRARDGERDLAAGRPWDGRPLDGERILVWTEQGLGDEIMAASLLPDILARAAHCTVVCSPRLVLLLQRAFPQATVVATGGTITGDFDARLPLMDAAQWLRPNFLAFPNRHGFLNADAAQTAALRGRYGADTHPLVGLSWRSASASTGPFKSTKLIDWANILKVPGLRFVSLQYGDCNDDVRAARRASGAEILVDPAVDPIQDLEMFAAQIGAMDLVISASNTTVHFASALGKPTWLLAPEGSGAHWYWFKDRSDNPWYPTLRIFRQQRPGAWDGTFAAVAAQLRTWCET
ncbi:MAG: tetratricopeptide repeat protein [Rhodospirillaceae bacterium]|nr:MAG: tetratricopeptide repeat protein [Rhodospirillaceae bacterium]